MAICHRGGVNEHDYIEITGIGVLIEGVSYGFEIDSQSALFRTGNQVGGNLIFFQLIEGSDVGQISFEINLLESAQVIVETEILSANTINCDIANNSVNFGILHKGGVYTTGSNYLTATSTSSFYWAVYGQGGGVSEQAGLYNSNGSGYLISSAGVNGKVNLKTGEGFGMLANSSSGKVMDDFLQTTSGVFGAIGKGSSEARLFLVVEEPFESIDATIHYGVRAGPDALEGAYQETLTYICGAYVGEGTLLASESLELGAPEIYEGNEYNNEWFNGEISVRSSITDLEGNGFDTDTCEVSIDGAIWTDLGVTYSGGYCHYYNYAPNDSFTIRFRIQDNSENWERSDESLFTYDNTAPTTTATMTSPPGGTAYTCGEFTAENVRAVLSCEDNEGGSGCDSNFPKYCTDSSDECTPSTSYSSNVDITDEGTTYIRYFSEDNLGKTETVQSCEINVAEGTPIEGWAWSTDFGYVSFTCENDDSCAESDYGVFLSGGGDLVGYAWSENVGWLKFDAFPDFDTEVYPSDPQHSAELDSDGSLCGEAGRVCGWARFCAATEAGDCESSTLSEWDGWVKLGPHGELDEYVSFDDISGDFFNSALVTDPSNETTISFNCEDTESCEESFYKVFLENDTEYTITYTSFGNGDVSPSSRLVKHYRTSAAPDTTPDEGGDFIDFEVIEGAGNGYLNTETGEVVGVSGDMTIQGNFADITPPSISASNASETWYGTQRTAVVSATDEASGIAEVRYNWGESSELSENCDSGGAETSHNASLDAPEGGTTLYLCARDNAGNTNTWSGTYNWWKKLLEGYAWSDNVGWISFSCENDDSCGVVDYGVEIENDGSLTGYAWNEQLGWLKFDPDPDFTTTQYPEAPQHSAKYDVDGTICDEAGRICGWSRFCAGTVNGDCTSETEEAWDGWVKLGPNEGSYVQYDENTRNLSGWAWGSENVGWISFSCEDTESCEEVDYGVVSTF